MGRIKKNVEDVSAVEANKESKENPKKDSGSVRKATAKNKEPLHKTLKVESDGNEPDKTLTNKTKMANATTKDLVQDKIDTDNTNGVIRSIKSKFKAFEMEIMHELNKLKKNHVTKNRPDKSDESKPAAKAATVNTTVKINEKKAVSVAAINEKPQSEAFQSKTPEHTKMEIKAKKPMHPIAENNVLEAGKQGNTFDVYLPAEKKKRRSKQSHKPEQKEKIFKFIVFFGKKDDEDSVINKSKKLADFINLYLNNKNFLNSLEQQSTDSKDINQKPTCTLAYQSNLAEKEADYIFAYKNVKETKMGEIIESIHERFFKAVQKGLCKDFVYFLDIRGDNNSNLYGNVK